MRLHHSLLRNKELLSRDFLSSSRMSHWEVEACLARWATGVPSPSDPAAVDVFFGIRYAASPAGAAALDGARTADSARGHRVGRSTRTSLPTSWQHRASAAVRELPLPECLRARNNYFGFEAARLSLDPWRRADHRNGCGLRPLCDGGGKTTSSL
jgi:hypothetical protein